MIRLSSATALGIVLLTACSDDGGGGTSAPSTDGGGQHDSGNPSDEDTGTTPTKDTGAPAVDAPVDAGSSPYPTKLSEAGLFSDLASETLAPGVRAFEPKYKLWSDGAQKRRWFRLPPGTTIDTSNMDFWQYPEGTTAWKEFSLGGKKLETRMLRKLGPKPEDWVMIAYQWNDAQTDAVALPRGANDVGGTQHDIPSAADCQQCHRNMKDRLLGVTAIQLSHQLGGMTLSDLITEGALSKPPAGPFTLPGPATAEQALGYLHANCGLCHNEQSSVSVSVDIRLWELTGKLATVEETRGYSTTVLQPNSFKPEFHVIEPGHPELSELVYRISRRGGGQMPPLGTEVVDPNGIALVRAWVESMPSVISDAGADAGDAGPTDAGVTDARAHD